MNSELNIELRLARLEATNRWYKKIALASTLILGVLICVGAKAGRDTREVEIKKLTCQEINVIQPDGRRVVTIGHKKAGGYMSLLDSRGENQILVSTGPYRIRDVDYYDDDIHSGGIYFRAKLRGDTEAREILTLSALNGTGYIGLRDTLFDRMHGDMAILTPQNGVEVLSKPAP